MALLLLLVVLVLELVLSRLSRVPEIKHLLRMKVQPPSEDLSPQSSLLSWDSAGVVGLDLLVVLDLVLDHAAAVVGVVVVDDEGEEGYMVEFVVF